MPELLDLQEEKRGDILLLRIKGRLDAISSPNTEKKLLDYIQSGHNRILLNFSEVEYLSSAGMRTLLTISKRLKSDSGKLVLSAVSPNVMDVLKMSGFDHVLNIAPSDEEGAKKF